MEDKKNTGADDTEFTENPEEDEEEFDPELDDIFDDSDDDDEDEDEYDEKEEKSNKKDNKDFIIKRLLDKVKKLETKSSPKKEDTSRIDKIAEQLEKEALERNIAKVIDSIPDAKHIEKALRKFAVHPTYKGVPLPRLARMLISEYKEKHLTKEEAKQRASASKDGGSNARTTVQPQGEVDFSKMTPKEVLEWKKKQPRR